MTEFLQDCSLMDTLPEYSIYEPTYDDEIEKLLSECLPNYQAQASLHSELAFNGV